MPGTAGKYPRQSNGKEPRRPNGKAPRHTGTSEGCCCGCQFCGATRLFVTIADVVQRACQTLADPTAHDPENCFYWRSAEITAGDINGEYCLAVSEDDPCCWCADIDTLTITFYAGDNCTGAVLCECSDVQIRVCATASGMTGEIRFRNQHCAVLAHSALDNPLLFTGSVTTGDPCGSTQEIPNDIDDTWGFDDGAPDIIVAEGGTMTVVPDGCAEVDVVPCGTLETQCPEDCSGCCASLVAVVTGSAGGACAPNDTYTLDRDGCNWTGDDNTACACVNGVWFLYIEPAGKTPLKFAAEDDGTGCPPETGWISCTGNECDGAAVTVTC